MSANRKCAIIVGALFITASVAGPLSGAFVPELFGPDDLANVWQLAANENQVLIGMLLEFTMAVAVAGISVWMYPVLRKHSEGVAIGYVGARIMEGMIYAVGVIGLLALLTLSKAYAAAGTPDDSVFQTLGATLLAVRLGGGVFGPLVYSIGAVLAYYVLHRTRLIPRWLSGWGLIGAALFLASSVLPLFGYGSRSTVYLLLNAPGGLNEMVLAVWLIVKGFDSSAIAPSTS